MHIVEAKDLVMMLRHMGWSGADIARAIGVTPPTVSRIASGYQMPKLDTYRRLFDAVSAEVKKADELREGFHRVTGQA